MRDARTVERRQVDEHGEVLYSKPWKMINEGLKRKDDRLEQKQLTKGKGIFLLQYQTESAADETKTKEIVKNQTVGRDVM